MATNDQLIRRPGQCLLKKTGKVITMEWKKMWILRRQRKKNSLL
jgi:hypothetical protein